MKTYRATDVGFVPVDVRVVERFTLGARPAVDPDKSEQRLMKTLHKAAESGVAPPAVEASEPAEDDSGRRGLFGRRR